MGTQQISEHTDGVEPGAHPRGRVTGLRAVGLVAVMLAAVSACSQVNQSRFPTYDGVPFQVKSKALDKKTNRALFQVVVANARRSEKGALEAGHHGSVRYCIETYGTSSFDWTNLSMDDEGALILAYDKDNAVFEGMCKP